MESKTTWNQVQKDIAEAIAEHDNAVLKRMPGASLVSTIYWKLVHKGHIRHEQETPREPDQS